MSKTNPITESIEDGQQNGQSGVATGHLFATDAVAPASSPDPRPETAGPTEPPPLPTEPPPLPDSVVMPPEPVLAPPSAPPQPPPIPVAQAAPPSASLVITAADPAMEERLRRLEALLAQTQQNLQTSEQHRITERAQTQQAPAASGPSVFGQAKALFDVGRQLMPSLPAGQAPPKTKGWLIWEMIAELRAIFCMYLDPRYRLPWYGYVIPPALLTAFIFSLYWIPFALVLQKASLHWLLTIPVDLLLLYSMYKILGHEARRYRETAPDLPPSLRL